MSGIEVPTFPKIEARTHANGSGEVTINGTSYPIETTTLEDARAAILARVAETAGKMQRPVRVTTTGPDGEWLPEATAPGGAPDVYESGYRYIGKGPFTNWHQKAKLDAFEAHKKEAGENANLNGVYFTAERIDYDVPGT